MCFNLTSFFVACFSKVASLTFNDSFVSSSPSSSVQCVTWITSIREEVGRRKKCRSFLRNNFLGALFYFNVFTAPRTDQIQCFRECCLMCRWAGLWHCTITMPFARIGSFSIQIYDNCLESSQLRAPLQATCSLGRLVYGTPGSSANWFLLSTCHECIWPPCWRCRPSRINKSRKAVGGMHWLEDRKQYSCAQCFWKTFSFEWNPRRWYWNHSVHRIFDWFTKKPPSSCNRGARRPRHLWSQYRSPQLGRGACVRATLVRKRSNLPVFYISICPAIFHT